MSIFKQLLTFSECALGWVLNLPIATENADILPPHEIKLDSKNYPRKVDSLKLVKNPLRKESIGSKHKRQGGLPALLCACH
jgi:hypothetical protein